MITMRDPAPGEVYYRGRGTPNGGGLVTVELDGNVIGVLRHVVRHSPTGIGWGYAGTGPADLALSLLAAALGTEATCTVCNGQGRVAWSDDADKEVPFDPTRHAPHQAARCWDCDGSRLRHLPYPALKVEVIAALPQPGWVLPHDVLLDWLTEHRTRR